MQISEDTRNVINFLGEYSGNTLRSADELSYMMDILAGIGSYDLMNEIIFIGKSVYNLYLTINKSNDENNQLKFLESEFAKSYDELLKALNKVLQFTPDSDERDILDLLLSSENPVLIINLAHDLSVLKDLQALLKSKRK
jgi:hypothetical protein